MRNQFRQKVTSKPWNCKFHTMTTHIHLCFEIQKKIKMQSIQYVIFSKQTLRRLHVINPNRVAIGVEINIIFALNPWIDPYLHWNESERKTCSFQWSRHQAPLQYNMLQCHNHYFNIFYLNSFSNSIFQQNKRSDEMDLNMIINAKESL